MSNQYYYLQTNKKTQNVKVLFAGNIGNEAVKMDSLDEQ